MALEINGELLWMLGCLIIAVLIGTFLIMRLKYKTQIKIMLLALFYVLVFFIIIDPIGIVYIFFQLKIAYQYIVGGFITLPMLIILISSSVNESYYDYVIVFLGIEFRPDHFIAMFFFFATVILFYLGYKEIKDLKQQNKTFRPFFKSK